jgi:L-ascorbate metabolism protein UlaG (beta-lactamase superfamily)
MRLRRLGWAGVEIETAGGTLVIDPLENASPLAPHVGEARAPPGSSSGPPEGGRSLNPPVRVWSADGF